MTTAPPRQFSLGTALGLVGALAPGLALLRVSWRLGLFVFDGPAPGSDGLDRGLVLARELLAVLSLTAGCLLAGLVPVVTLLGLGRHRDGWRVAVRGPGLVACLVAIAAAVGPLAWFAGAVLAESRSIEPNFATGLGNLFHRWIHGAGPMILGAWIALALQGRWRPAPTWTDRAGWLLGAAFVLIDLAAEAYFAVALYVDWWRR